MTDTVAQPPPAVQAVCPPAAATTAHAFFARVLVRAEWGVAALATLLFCSLHFFFSRHVGALWRDEANSLNLATLPTFADVWSHLAYESFPVLYPALLRGWAGVFGADNDVVLRGLGLLIGLGIVGALWLNARQFGGRGPLLSLVLLGGNPLFIRYADSLRGYGLGILTMLLTLAAVWRVLMRPSAGRVAVAMGMGVLCVQALYFNAVLLLAMCGGAAVAAGAERRWRTAALLLAIGLPAALSLVPYIGIVQHVRTWNFIVQPYPMTLDLLWSGFSEVTGSPDPLGVWVWSALFVGGLALAGWQEWRSRATGNPPAGEARDVPTTSPARVCRFAAVTLLVAVMGYAEFLKVLGYHMHPWHYVGFLALAAACLDALSGALLEVGGWTVAARLSGHTARLVLTVGLMAISFVPAQVQLAAHQTNVDMHARWLNAHAAAGDLVVSNRWEYAISLARYYHGPAALVSLPPLDEHRFHCYDQTIPQMMIPDAIAPVLARMEATLRAGHRVWVSGLPVTPIARHPPAAPPVLRLVDGKAAFHSDYYVYWTAQGNYLLGEHAAMSVVLPTSDGQPVAEHEQAALEVFEGWR